MSGSSGSIDAEKFIKKEAARTNKARKKQENKTKNINININIQRPSRSSFETAALTSAQHSKSTRRRARTIANCAWRREFERVAISSSDSNRLPQPQRS